MASTTSSCARWSGGKRCRVSDAADLEFGKPTYTSGSASPLCITMRTSIRRCFRGAASFER
eukprot:scaffold1906_cov403-Prasinococcus_capsulatus_cf.AAC.12